METVTAFPINMIHPFQWGKTHGAHEGSPTIMVKRITITLQLPTYITGQQFQIIGCPMFPALLRRPPCTNITPSIKLFHSIII
jgi:hypothetical protein